MQLPVPFLPQGADRGHVADPHSNAFKRFCIYMTGLI
jgi:hypothetical protein